MSFFADVHDYCNSPSKKKEKVIAQQLQDSKVEINALGGLFNETPLAIVVKACCLYPNKPHLTKLLSQIIDAGADINAQGASGKTAIQEASKNNLVKIFFNNLVLRKQSKDNIEKYAKLFFEIDSPISFLGLDVVAIVAGYSGSLIHTPAEAAKIATKYLKN